MCPMVPMLTCGLVRWNLAFATGFSSLVSVSVLPPVAAGHPPWLGWWDRFWGPN
jgi:hypothetical protein